MPRRRSPLLIFLLTWAGAAADSVYDLSFRRQNALPGNFMTSVCSAMTAQSRNFGITAMTEMPQADIRRNILYWPERVALAAAFRWTARLNMHEAVANHFSLAVSDDAKFLMNPNQAHFSRIRASDLLLLDAHNPDNGTGPNAPDPTAWFLHGAVHRNCLHARCVMHVHSVHATVLASLADSELPPIDQNSAMFFNRHVIDQHYGGLALEDEGERCSALLADPLRRVMVMGNHGILVIGNDVADAFNRMYYFERAAETYIRALQTGRELRIMPAGIAEKTAAEIDAYPEQAERHFSELMAILDSEGSDYAS